MFLLLRKLTLPCISVLFFLSESFALPPLGLTQTDPSFGSLEIIDGTAYISAPGGIRTVSSSGDLGFIGVSHPTLSPLFFTTTVVKANDGELYVAASYGDVFNPLGGSLFRLAEPTTPIVTWQGDYRVQDIDRELRGYGTVTLSGFQNSEASRFFLDGTIVPLPYPPGSDRSNNDTYLFSATPNGYALGDAAIPGTAGSSPLLWTPDGSFDSFVFGLGSASSIRDRNDGQGVNVGSNLIGANVLYGSTEIEILDPNGGYFSVDNGVVVSQSDFVAFRGTSFAGDLGLYGYYPGIDPAHPDRAVPLLDIFPELATIDFDFVSDVVSVDGFLYMTLRGDGGRFLFGARDPSVVPEPAAIVMILLSVLPWQRAWGRSH